MNINQYIFYRIYRLCKLSGAFMLDSKNTKIEVRHPSGPVTFSFHKTAIVELDVLRNVFVVKVEYIRNGVIFTVNNVVHVHIPTL